MNKLKVGISLAITCGISFSIIGYFERGIFGMIADFFRVLFFSGIGIALYFYLIYSVSQIKLNNAKSGATLIAPFLFTLCGGLYEYSRTNPLSDKVLQTASAFILGTLVTIFIFKMITSKSARNYFLEEFGPLIGGVFIIGFLIFLIWLFINY
jgi:hypothetical protein